jgi:hypothetical protein
MKVWKKIKCFAIAAAQHVKTTFLSHSTLMNPNGVLLGCNEYANLSD